MGDKPDPKLTDFKAWARLLRRAIAKAEAHESSGEAVCPADSSYGVIRVHCYRYLRHLERNGLIEQLRSYVEARDPGRWHRHRGSDADWVLRLLERPSKNEWLTPPRRGRIVLHLTFALKCRISSTWLLPFLYECGNDALIKAALKADHVPPSARKYHLVSRKQRKPQRALAEPFKSETVGPPLLAVAAEPK